MIEQQNKITRNRNWYAENVTQTPMLPRLPVPPYPPGYES